MPDSKEQELFIADQAALIRRLCQGYRLIFLEADRQIPNIDAIKGLCDDYYPGPSGSCFRAAYAKGGRV